MIKSWFLNHLKQMAMKESPLHSGRIDNSAHYMLKVSSVIYGSTLAIFSGNICNTLFYFNWFISDPMYYYYYFYNFYRKPDVFVSFVYTPGMKSVLEICANISRFCYWIHWQIYSRLIKNRIGYEITWYLFSYMEVNSGQ